MHHLTLFIKKRKTSFISVFKLSDPPMGGLLYRLSVCYISGLMLFILKAESHRLPLNFGFAMVPRVT